MMRPQSPQADPRPRQKLTARADILGALLVLAASAIVLLRGLVLP